MYERGEHRKARSRHRTAGTPPFTRSAASRFCRRLTDLWSCRFRVPGAGVRFEVHGSWFEFDPPAPAARW